MSSDKYFNRDLSWLAFNKRVLMEAKSDLVPLYERIKFLAIFASNLDEFFEVRVAFIKRMIQLDKGKINEKTDISSPKKILKNIYNEVCEQQNMFGSTFKDFILPGLKENNIHLYHNKKFYKKHLDKVSEIFYSKALSFIQPIVITKDKPQSVFLNNGQLYLVCDLEKDNMKYLGIVNIPSKELNRFFELPKINGVHQYTFLDDIIKHFSSIIFSGFNIGSQGTLKLSRDAELFLEDDFGEDVAKKIHKSLKNREIGDPTRLLYDPVITDLVFNVLIKSLSLNEDDCVEGGQYHNMSNLFSLPNPVGKHLENPPNPSLPHKHLTGRGSMFEAIQENDVLLSFPYQRYGYILRLFNEAAIDPAVVSIKATLYRVARDSHITNALISAARNGKQVEVLVEAKARFDEENNLKWARKLQNAGVDVIFSTLSLKVHSKVALITREDSDGATTNFAFLGTGNFNEKTADVYTDYALLTTDVNLTNELEDALNYIIHGDELKKLKHLLVAQINMPQVFTKLINREIKYAKEGKEARITLKLNNLQDKNMIKLLYKAANNGVKLDLIIRGICCLIPRKNIHLIRLVDRYLEHSRVYIFNAGGDEKMFIGSADWMARNLYRRIEIVFPIYDKQVKETIKHNIKLQLKDTLKAVKIGANLESIAFKKNGKSVRAQQAFYKYLSEQSK